ncbi:MAG TPA: hypothetical protein VMV81_12825, partial [Phycisphaerae bacterium]|nr:hypothetical protein [Phycisphaerae bacterium]
MNARPGELIHATNERVCSKLGAARRGLSLAETLIGVTILVGLFSIVVVSTRMAGSSSKRSTAQQELAQIAAAISQYASFWPAWNINGTLVAQKGWPDFCPSRLFAVPPYTTLAGFNDATRVNFDVINGVTRYQSYDIVSPGLVPDTATDISVLDANVALAYQLTAVAGKGPYL